MRCHALGTGDEALAKLTSKLSLVVIACVQTFTGLCLIALRHQVHANALPLPLSSSRIILQWGYIFSESAAVVQEVAQVLPLCGCYAVLDAICGVSAGKGQRVRVTFLYLPYSFIFLNLPLSSSHLLQASCAPAASRWSVPSPTFSRTGL